MTDERVALITAEGSGMGADAARRLSADEFRIAILSSSDKGEAPASELGGVGVTGSGRASSSLGTLASSNRDNFRNQEKIALKQHVTLKRRTLLAAAAAAAAAAATLGAAVVTAPANADTPRMGVVVKIGGIPWFNAMEVGIKARAEELGWDAWMVGPTSADPALQVRAVEDLIAQGVDAVGVVPNDAEVLEPVLAKAREQGILVITHESPDQQNVDWNFELASATGFGEAHAKMLAEKMGGEGQYAVYVGSLTVPLHNAWADAAIAWLAANHPGMVKVADRFGVAESVDDSRSTALDLMRAHPDLGGFLAFGSQGPIGAGRAVQERRKTGEVHVLGPFSPGQGRRLVHDGVLTGGFMWNPMEAGRVFVTMADHLKKGMAVEKGTMIEGLGEVDPDFETRNIIVDQLVALNKGTVDELAEMGL